MLVSARIAALLLTLAVLGCSSQMVPGSSGGSGSAGSGSSGLSGGNGGGSGSSGGSGGDPSSTCGSGGSTGAAAYVYVAQGSNSATTQAFGFYAAANGTLTPMPGSPFPTAGALPVTGAGSVLFGIAGSNIDSFRVHRDGCLSLESSLPAGQETSANPPMQPSMLYLDPKNANLYSFDFNPPDNLGSLFASYSVDPGTGQLSPVGGDVVAGNGLLAIASSGHYAVGTDCNIRGGRFIAEYQRGGDGALTLVGYGPMPAAAPGNSWCPTGVAADGSDHIIVGVADWPGLPPSSNTAVDQLAIYSLDDAGKLSTASTWQNMVTTDVGDLDAFQFSPDYRYLLVTGYFGFEIFAWDSASATLSPIATLRSGAYCWSNSTGAGCTGPFFGGVAWDENDHLYTTLNQQLLVYSVTSSGVAPVSGSPYRVPNARSVTVLPQSADGSGTLN